MIHSTKLDLLKTGYYILLITAVSRPIITVLEGTHLPLHRIIPAGLTYISLLLLLLSASFIKWDSVSLVIVLFCGYAIASLAWGTELYPLMQLILPFTCYFAAKTFVKDVSSVRQIVIGLLIGYFVPIAGSSALILSGLSPSHEVYGSVMLRKTGMYGGTHTAAHSLVLFSFIYAIYLTYKDSKRLFFKYMAHFLFMLSIYCLWNTYVRSAFLGLTVLWMT